MNMNLPGICITSILSEIDRSNSIIGDVAHTTASLDMEILEIKGHRISCRTNRRRQKWLFLHKSSENGIDKTTPFIQTPCPFRYSFFS